MSLSDDFTKLKEQVENADQTIRAAVAKDDAELRAMVDDARKKADDREAELRGTSTEVADQAERHWNDVKSDWDQHIQRIRKHLDAKKAEVDATVAENDAEWSEDDAYDAVQFASSAIDEAQYAVLDAVLARRKADVLAAAK
jgi:small-conductance mechanosensitive channel